MWLQTRGKVWVDYFSSTGSGFLLVYSILQGHQRTPGRGGFKFGWVWTTVT